MNSVEELKDVLHRLTDCYQALAEAKERERDAVLEVDLAALEECNRTQERLQLEAKVLEKQRERVVKRIAAAWDVPAEGLSLLELGRRLPEGEAHGLQQLGDGLTGIILRVEQLNSVNRDLVLQSLQFVRQAIRELAGAPARGDAYNWRGEAGPPPGDPLVLDRRI